MEEIYKRAGNRIRSLREEKGLSREELAKQSGISPRYLYNIETGKNRFSAGNLYLLSTILETDCDYIMTGRRKNHYEDRFQNLLNGLEEKQAERIQDILSLFEELLKNIEK